MSGTLPPAEWARLARQVERRAKLLWDGRWKPTPGWLTQQATLVAQMESLIGTVGGDAARAAALYGDDFLPAITRARELLVDTVPTTTRQAVDDFARVVGKPVADPNLLRSVVNRTGQAILSDWGNLAADVRVTVADTIASAAAAGDSPATLAKALERDAEMVRWRASTIARTELMSAHDDVQHLLYEQLGVEEWVWRAQPTACGICYALHGQKFSADEATGRHPNCRCIMVPVVDGVKPPKPNSLEAVNERFPRRLQLQRAANGKLSGERAALMRRLVVNDNPKWKPSWGFAPPGTTKFKKPIPPKWVRPDGTEPPVTPVTAPVSSWAGKPKPTPPVEPTAPATRGAAAFDPWLQAVKDRFTAFAKKSGNPKTDLTKSNNWSQVEQVIQRGALGDKEGMTNALDYLYQQAYLDLDLYAKAKIAYKKAGEIVGDEDAYKRALADYSLAMQRYADDLAEWRAANGVTVELRGIDDGFLWHSTNDAGTRWAQATMPKPPPAPSKSALREYTGSSYYSWNEALRKIKGRFDLPGGRWDAKTKVADAGMQTIPEDVILRRGTTPIEFAMPDGSRAQTVSDIRSLIGSVQTWKAYASTSVGREPAFLKSVRLRIAAPKGTRGVYADPWSANPGERELILGRGTRFYVHDVQDRGDYTQVDVEVIPDDADPDDYVGLTPIKSKEVDK